MNPPPCPSGSQAEFSPTTQHPAQVPKSAHSPALTATLRAKEALVSREPGHARSPRGSCLQGPKSHHHGFINQEASTGSSSCHWAGGLVSALQGAPVSVLRGQTDRCVEDGRIHNSTPRSLREWPRPVHQAAPWDCEMGLGMWALVGLSLGAQVLAVERVQGPGGKRWEGRGRARGGPGSGMDATSALR